MENLRLRENTCSGMSTSSDMRICFFMVFPSPNIHLASAWIRIVPMNALTYNERIDKNGVHAAAARNEQKKESELLKLASKCCMNCLKLNCQWRIARNMSLSAQWKNIEIYNNTDPSEKERILVLFRFNRYWRKDLSTDVFESFVSQNNFSRALQPIHHLVEKLQKKKQLSNWFD